MKARVIELEKRIARELLERFPDKFTTAYENNKKLVDAFTNISSEQLRNGVAGYITQLCACANLSMGLMFCATNLF